MALWDVVGNDANGNLSVVQDPPPKGYHILPGSGGPYPTKAQAQAALNALNNVIANPEPTNPFSGKDIIPGVPNPLNAIPNPVSGLSALYDFLGTLTQKNTWIRAAEILLGLSLIIVGLSKISGVGKYIPKVV